MVSFKTTKNARKPARLSKVTKFRQPGRKANAAIRALAKQAGRPELTRVALARATKIKQIKTGRKANRTIF